MTTCWATSIMLHPAYNIYPPLHYSNTLTLIMCIHGWQLWTPPPKLHSCVISCLQNKLPASKLWHPTPLPPMPTGAFGQNSALNFSSILSHKTSPILLKSYKCSFTKSKQGPLHLKSQPPPPPPIKSRVAWLRILHHHRRCHHSYQYSVVPILLAELS